MGAVFILFRKAILQIKSLKSRLALLFLISQFITCFGQDNHPVEKIKYKAALYQYINEYDSALLYYTLLEDSRDAVLSPDERIQNQISICAILIQKNDFQNAFRRLANVEIQIGQLSSPDPSLEAGLYQVRGAYLLSNRNDSSRYFLEKSIEIRSKHSGNKDTLLYYAWNKLGLYFLRKADFEGATRCYQNALDLSLEKKSVSNYQSASAYQNLAIAFHQQGDYSRAESYFLKSRDINEKLYNTSNPQLAYIYNNLGKFYNDLSKYDEAISYYDKSENLLINSKGVDIKNLLAVVYGNKGNVFTHKGDYEKAISYLTKAINLYESISQKQSDYYLRTLMDLGLVYDMKGDYYQAIKYYSESAKNTELPSVVKSYRNLGNLYSRLDINDSALYFYRRAIHYTNIFYKEPSYDMALCYQYYGEVLNKSGSDSAIWYYDKSIGILDSLFDENNRDIARVRWLIGGYLLRKQKYDDAIAINQLAINGLMTGQPDKNFRMDNLLDVPRDIFIPDALFLKAKSLYLRYKEYENITDLEEGLLTVQLALKVIELIRTTYYDEETQMILNNNTRLSLDLGLRIAFDLYNATGEKKYLSEAFLYSEKGKAIILLGALRGLEAKSTASIPQYMIEKESALNKEIATFNNLVYDEKQKPHPDQVKISILNDTLFSLRKSFESLMHEYQKQYPDYYRLKYDYTIIPSDSLENLLDGDQAILEYHIADSVIFGFLIKKGSFYLKELGKISDIGFRLEGLRNLFSRSAYFNSGLEDFLSLNEISHDLYLKLIFPFEKDIESKRLLIIPDAELGYLAFDLLLSEMVAGNSINYKDLPWLIRNHPISYSSSATIYFEQSSKRKKQKAARELIAFAPNYEYFRAVRDGTSTDSLFYSLPPIIGTEEEVNSISGIYRSKKFLNQEASEEKFKRLAPDYGILHLAMHTVINNQKPLYSKLVFSKMEEGAPDDGYLNTYELFNLSLNGELAVLSACNTGTGKLERGEGIISLARGFFYSGIPSVVMTLWEIEDHSSADLITLFYENLKKGMTKDVAMQQAKLDYLQGSDQLHSHPYFWAGFVVIGKTEPLPSSYPVPIRNLLIWIALPVLLITCALFLYKKRVFFFKNRIKR